MARVMAVSFNRYGRLHYLDAGEHTYRVGDKVLVPTDEGTEVAECVWSPTEAEPWEGLPPCAGLATPDDLERDERMRRRRAEAMSVSRALVKKHQLEMKVVGVDVLDRSDDYDLLTVIYFHAPQRVDFRALLGDLARSLRSRIDLRQIGSRDVARIVGGVGSCGREFCCNTFQTDFEPVNARMGRVQDLPSNPLQISGACGRLMCCLKYEHPLYVDFARKAPSVGQEVSAGDVSGVVVGHSVPSESVLVRDSGGQITRCPLADICVRRAAAPKLDE
ncbi:MAG: hypothetical protein CR980_01005 [Propionibacteriales bacterium]|nr:MAG: hypothetical protein CR980_01005 [Propionibacteriales bacterium]